jgi:methylated-DNA-[protein]-cysteine S-methyltransferase
MQRTEIIVSDPLKLTLTWRGDKIAGIRLDWKAEDDLSDFSSPQAGRLEHALAAYLEGKHVVWPDLPLDFASVGGFAREVLAELAKVGYGQCATYGELAARAGRPGAARAVGRVMAANPFPLVLPCHRIVGSNMKLTGFGPGLPMKKMLLELEGVLK